MACPLFFHRRDVYHHCDLFGRAFYELLLWNSTPSFLCRKFTVNFLVGCENFLGAAIGTLAVIFGGCAYKIHELAEGGSALAESLGRTAHRFK